jgi:LAS superfamily LD-carboxypeptidase LdcB
MEQGNILGEEFKKYVFDQIDVRQSIHGAGGQSSLLNRDPKYLNYLNNRNAWVKMASGISLVDKIDGEKLPEKLTGLSRLQSISNDLGDSSSNIILKKYNSTGLAKNFVLFNTLSNLNFEKGNQKFENYTFRSGIQRSQESWLDVDSSYGFGGTAMGFQPTPGIIDVSIDCVNRGSIRKATVTLKAYNRYQFSIIEMLYLRLGYTMMLEWGWDKYAVKNGNDYDIQDTGNTIIEDLWFKDINYNPTKMIAAIERYREIYYGNYDGFFGKVNNFTWNFNPDGSYDITINLITVGDVVESLKVNTSAPITNKEELIDYQKKLKDKKNFSEEALNYLSMGNDVVSRYLNQLIINHDGNNANSPLISYNSIPGVTPEVYGNPLPKGEFNYFIRFGLFLDTLTNLVIPKASENESIIAIETNSEDNYIKTYFNQLPIDPKVCLFTMKWGKNFLDSYLNLKNRFPFSKINAGLPQKFIVEKDGFTAGKLMNIYLNVNFLLKILKDNVDEKGNLSLYTLVESICNGLNQSLGGFNNLEPVIKDDKTLVIIDQNPIPGLSKFLQKSLPPKENPRIEVFGYNGGKSNFVKDIKFQTKIDNSLASMISIGATADGKSTKNSDATAFSKWNVGLKDRFQLQYKDPKPVLLAENTTAMGKDLIQYKKDAYNYALANIQSTTSAKWVLAFSSTFPTTSGNNIIGYKDILGTKEDVARKFVQDTTKKIKELDAKTYEKNEIERLTQNTYAGYLHDLFGATFNYTFSNGTVKTEVNIVKKYNQLFTDDTLVDRGKTTFKSYINTLIQEKFVTSQEASGNIGFIPISFDITLEGLSGVKIYNKLNVDTRFLPPNYGDALDFLITKVNHKISGNNWDTILGTISTSNIKDNTSDDTSNISGDLDEVIITDFSRNKGGTTRKILGTTYTNGEVPDDKLRTINNESKYKGAIQSDKGDKSGRIRLFTEASLALDKLLEQAEKDGITFRINSAYRTLDDQDRVFKANCQNAIGSGKCIPKIDPTTGKKKGPAAIPGTSNHGFGLAVDFAKPQATAISPQDPQYQWLAANASSFGFKRLPYKNNNENWESWHWEYQISTVTNTEATIISTTSTLLNIL